jgi:O-antigen/teichoic acid export membrane protein
LILIDKSKSILRQHLYRSGAWAFLGRASETGFNLVETVLLARILAPVELGSYFLLFSIIVLVGNLAQFGLGQAAIRLIGESLVAGSLYNPARVVRRVTVYGLIGAAVGALVLLGGGVDLLSRYLFRSTDLSDVALPVGLTAGLWTLRTLIAELFRALNDIKWASVFSRLSVGLVTVPIYFLIWVGWGHASLSQVLWVMFTASLAACLVGAWRLRRKTIDMGASDHGGALPELARESWPIFLNALVVIPLSYVNIWLLAAYATQEDVALFGAAARLSGIVIVPLVVVNAVVGPLVAQFFAAGSMAMLRRILGASAGIALVVGLVAGGILILFRGQVLELAFGSFYIAAAGALTVITLAQLINLGSGPGALTLVLTGHQRLRLLITFVVGLINVALAWVLISRFLLIGAAVSMAFGLITQNVACWIAVRARLGIWTHGTLRGWLELIRGLRGDRA